MCNIKYIMTTNLWGPFIWRLFHVLAYKLKDESFHIVGIDLFNFIKRICSNLPCPDCARHASFFLSKINPLVIRSKKDLIITLFIFHNSVNKRKDKPLETEGILRQYENENIFNVYNNFIRVFHTNKNHKLLADNLHRKFIVKDFKSWFLSNLKHFNI